MERIEAKARGGNQEGEARREEVMSDKTFEARRLAQRVAAVGLTEEGIAKMAVEAGVTIEAFQRVFEVRDAMDDGRIERPASEGERKTLAEWAKELGEKEELLLKVTWPTAGVPGSRLAPLTEQPV